MPEVLGVEEWGVGGGRGWAVVGSGGCEQSWAEPSDQHFLIIKLQINLLHWKRRLTKGTLSCCQHLIEPYLLPRANKAHLNAFRHQSLSKRENFLLTEAS